MLDSIMPNTPITLQLKQSNNLNKGITLAITLAKQENAIIISNH